MKKVRLFEQFVNEASVNRGKIHKAVKKASYPVTLVVIDGKEVCHQELVNTPMEVPAVVSVLKDEYPNCKIQVESKTGEVVFVQESLTKGHINEDVFRTYNELVGYEYNEFVDAFKKLHKDNVVTYDNKEDAFYGHRKGSNDSFWKYFEDEGRIYHSEKDRDVLGLINAFNMVKRNHPWSK